jgi:hypothetical protein
MYRSPQTPPPTLAALLALADDEANCGSDGDEVQGEEEEDELLPLETLDDEEGSR